jgi:hypothetical protein
MGGWPVRFPASNHIVWKILLTVILFLFLMGSKYLGYEQWDSWKDIRNAVVETLVIVLAILGKSFFSKS